MTKANRRIRYTSVTAIERGAKEVQYMGRLRNIVTAALAEYGILLSDRPKPIRYTIAVVLIKQSCHQPQVA